VRIDIFSDVVCPWCFIGKRRLERALAMRSGINAQIAWQPFQLNPEIPREGVPSDAFFSAKFGDLDQFKRRRKAIVEIGTSVGIPFDFDGVERQPNTLDAHRLIRFAAGFGHADAVVEALFRAHFVEARDIGDRAILTAIADEAGGDADEAAAFLAGESGIDETASAEREARRIGVDAVPCYVFDRQYAVSGAQEPEIFLPVFDLVLGGSAASTQASR
jgi:predicted DsbA family dithiol-disulfide isomerase